MKKLSETIKDWNWCKDSLVRDGRGCLLYYITDTDTLHAVEGSILALFPERAYRRAPAGLVPGFNDHPDTTLEDVLRVLKFADV